MTKITFFHKRFCIIKTTDIYMYGKNIDGKNLPPELTRSKANTKAIAFSRRKLRGP